MGTVIWLVSSYALLLRLGDAQKQTPVVSRGGVGGGGWNGSSLFSKRHPQKRLKRFPRTQYRLNV